MYNRLVIARYNEDVDWAKDYNNIIYNKQSGDNLLPNVGREAHTYLYHIINNYDNLDDITIFLQGDPFFHIDKKELSDVYHGFKGQFRSLGKKGTDNIEKFSDCIKYAFFSEDGVVIPSDKTTNIENYVLQVPEIQYDKAIQSMFILPKEIEYAFAAQFGVKKEAIRNRSLDWYKKVIKLVDCCNAPIGAHFFERFWQYVFQPELFPFKLNVL